MAHLAYYNTMRTILETTRNSSISLIEKVCEELGKPEEAERLVGILVDDSIRIKKFKDKNSPKKVKSAYMFYCQKHRASVKESLGGKDVKFATIVKKLAEDWKILEDKSEYEKQSEEDKERYSADMEKYNASLYTN
jgi:hypothetical protein